MNIDKGGLKDKVEFIVFHIAFGLIFWLVTASVVGLKRAFIGGLNYRALNLIMYLCIYILPIYFWGKLNTKIQWKPFGRYSGIISFCCNFGTAVILIFALGYFEISMVRIW